LSWSGLQSRKRRSESEDNRLMGWGIPDSARVTVSNEVQRGVLRSIFDGE
jgi:hypothetical protein